MNIRIVLSKLFPRRLLGKAPPDSGSDRIPLLLPSAPLTGQRLAIAKAAIQALFGYGGELNFRHVRPTAFFRGVMIVKLLRESKGDFWRKRVIKGPRRTRIEIILDQADRFGLGVMLLDQLFHKLRVIHLGATLTDLDHAGAGQRFKCKK